MANPLHGEVEIVADGRRRVLRLSLGALAALEAELNCEGLVELAGRFERGGVRADDVIAVLAAGFRGAGDEAAALEVAQMRFEGGALGATKVAARLLSAAFTGEA
ncbi:MAG: gene transfer agent family protein [Rubrimonas sp.]|uniref:gene transfer agent family protein n=1 Tax=Rubrimonas sp. TaxID=2036015 RepID=UPI002FDE6BB2